ncbi:MAG: polymerase subunit gamma/tau [Acidobacteriota bacterium]|nr:polymerase subunit gamma/tau [Acidobacteriota bacterium]
MSYQVIARKWRPQAFEEVTGQEPITRTLRNAVEHERLHHAYLFSGARGVGKTTTARLLAKALNCHKSDRPTPTPCRADDETACASCREIAEGRSIDVLEIDAASNTGVDNVREAIINTVGVRPARDRFKVFIIDEVHMLSTQAFNALLKTLEEPPPRVVFIMATTESHKIPDTILSRSQQFQFRTIPTQKIFARLRLIADAEKIKVSDDALREIARAGEGSMRDAQSAFDQVISFSEGEIATDDVEAALGIAGAQLLARAMNAVAACETKEALAVVEDLAARGHDLRNFCRDLLAHLRDLLVVKVAGEASELADATDAERKGLVREASEFSESDLVRFFNSLTDTEQRLREGAHPRYQLEIGLVKLIEMRRLAPLSQILERLNALEEALRTGKTTASLGSPTPTGGAGSGSAERGGGGGVPPASRFPKSRADSQVSQGAATGLAPSREDGATRRSASENKRTGADSNAANANDRAGANADAGTGANAQGFDAASDEMPPWETPASAAPPALRLVESAQTSPDASSDTSSAAVRLTNGDGFSLVSTQAPPRVEREMPATQSAPNTFVEQLKSALEDRRKPFLATALEGARKVEVHGDELLVEFAPESKFLRDNLSKPENARLVREACSEIVGRETGLQIVVRDESESQEAAAEDAGRAARDRLREMAEQDPQVQDVLRIFRAEIVDVRPSDKV